MAGKDIGNIHSMSEPLIWAAWQGSYIGLADLLTGLTHSQTSPRELSNDTTKALPQTPDA